MTKENNIGFISLAVLAITGNILLNIKFTGNIANDIIGTLSAFILSVLTSFAMLQITKLKFNKNKLLYASFMFLLLALFLTVIVFTLESFSRFAANIMLSTKELLIPFATLLAVALFLGLSNKNILFKLSIIILPITLFIFIAIFLYSIRFMSIKYFIPYQAVSFGWFDTFLPLYLNLTVSSAAIIALDKDKNKKTHIISYLMVLSIVLLSFATIIGVFGSELASTFKYPFQKAIGTVALGEIFSRLDGFFYFICFFTALIKLSVFIFLFKKIFFKFLHFTIAKWK